jgi:hypothetical protein
MIIAMYTHDKQVLAITLEQQAIEQGSQDPSFKLIYNVKSSISASLSALMTSYAAERNQTTSQDPSLSIINLHLVYSRGWMIILAMKEGMAMYIACSRL